MRLQDDMPYGLTLVLGCPLPADILARIEAIKQTCRAITPSSIAFGPSYAYHLTIYGLKRSRPQPHTRMELAPVLDALGQVLHRELSSVATLVVPLAGLVVDDQGTILICGAEVGLVSRLRAAISRIPQVDPPKVTFNHITVGQFKRPFASDEAWQYVMRTIGAAHRAPIGELVARELKLVYYRSRLLDDVVGQETIRLPVRDAHAELGRTLLSTL